MRTSTLTTVLIAVLGGLFAAVIAAASPAAADDFDLVAEIEPLVPGDPGIDDFAAPPALSFDLRVDCEGGLPPVTLWMKNSGATDVTLEVHDYAGSAGVVLEAGGEAVVEIGFDAYEMDVALARVYEKDGPEMFEEYEDIVCLRPDVSFEFVVDCDVPVARVELTNHGVLPAQGGITVDAADPEVVWIDAGQTVGMNLPHAPDQALEVEVFAGGEYAFSGPWSYSCPDATGEADAVEVAPPPVDVEPEPATEPGNPPVDVIEAPEPKVDATDTEETAATVVIPVAGGGPSAGVGVALVLGFGLVALLVASGVALSRARL